MSIRILGNTYPVKDQLKSLGCRWDAAAKCWTASTEDIATKARAIVGGQAPLNSPPPQDLGPIDCAAEATKHGRKAIGTESVPFRQSSSKGDKPVGETFWGKRQGKRDRYLIVRAGRPYYMSRDRLEDFDLFDLDPGWYVDVEAVAVEPTDEERANDPAVAKAQAAALAQRRREIVDAVQCSPQEKDARLQSHSTTGMVKCWGESRMAGHETLWSDGVSRLVYETSSYDDSPASWGCTDPALAAEAVTLKTA